MINTLYLRHRCFQKQDLNKHFTLDDQLQNEWIWELICIEIKSFILCLTFCVVVTLLWICLPLAVRSLVTSFEMTIGSHLASILAKKSGYKLLRYMLGIKIFIVYHMLSIRNADVTSWATHRLVWNTLRSPLSGRRRGSAEEWRAKGKFWADTAASR